MATEIHSTTAPELTKRIAYNRDNRDYDCYIAIDGGNEEYIGSAATYGDAEKKCRDYAFDYYTDNHTPEKAVQIALSDIPIPVLVPEVTESYCDYGRTLACGTGADEVEVIIGNDDPRPYLFAFGRDPLTLDEVERALPHIIALLADERVRRARRMAAVAA